jgi:hypothetical protein
VVLHKRARGEQSGIMDMLRNVNTSRLDGLQELLDAKRSYAYPTAAVPAYGIFDDPRLAKDNFWRQTDKYVMRYPLFSI